jgi:RNA polymerase sigma-70 factor (ECF subfamily)
VWAQTEPISAVTGTLATHTPAKVPSVAEVFRELAPFVWRALRRLGVAERDVEDVCQEVFMVVHRKLPEFEGRSTVRTWVYGIAVRVASDYRKRGHIRREVMPDEMPENVSSSDPHSDAARRQAREKLDRILDALDEGKREVFVLYEIEQMTMAEVAEIVGCPLQTAYSRLHAARKQVEGAITDASTERGGLS